MEEKLRKVFEDQLHTQILGPGYTKEIFVCKPDYSDEILDKDPLDVYSTGILMPESKDGKDNYDIDDADDNFDDSDFVPDVDTTDDDDDGDDKGLSERKSDDDDDYGAAITPRHIGLITCVTEDTHSINVDVKYAKYAPLPDNEIPQVKVKLGYHYQYLRDLLNFYDNDENLRAEIQDNGYNEPFSSYIIPNDEDHSISIKERIKIDTKKFPYCQQDHLKRLHFLLSRLFTKLYRRQAFTGNFDISIDKEIEQSGRFSNLDLDYCLNVYRANGKKYVKLLVRNRNTCEGRINYSKALFQTEAKISPKDGRLMIFSEPVRMAIDEENTRNEYIYRNVCNYGKGVGCAAMWDDEGKWIKTSYMPHNDVKKFSSQLGNDYCKKLGLQADDLKECCKLYNLSHWQENNNEILSRLRTFVNGYDKWHNDQRANIPQEPDKDASTAKKILESQQELLVRLNDNIDYLENNQEALNCFKLANTAMLIQMTIARNPHFKKNRWVDDITEDRNFLNSLNWFQGNTDARYYPFQLAFLLMNVKSTFETDDKYHKNIVDLIWFPTGGGKTEAYLALTALTIIARRRRSNDANLTKGVSVIMRYTLRLLTSQQFERASYLICALEFMRNKLPNTANLGRTPITIGQWIGNSSMNEWVNNTGRWYRFNHMANAERLTASNPHPVTYCPWCGGKLVGRAPNYPFGYEEYSHIRCLNNNCCFVNGLPIYYVDEALYNNPPTLLFATVDKLAQIYKNDPARLFGRNGSTAMSPDLIIQDELHLISGPLGSMVGFFESIVEKMATKDGRSPKIIASTATTRNTDKLVRSLYARDVRVFPAQGITYDDNYFSHVETESLRRHLAICPGGGRHLKPVTAENRIISQLILARISMIKYYLEKKGVDLNDFQATNNALSHNNRLKEEIDNYWSLVLYYNSLKDLGRTRSRVGNEIAENIRYQKRYMQIPPALNFVISEVDKRIKEFTSREDSSRIKDLLTAAESVTEFAPQNNPGDPLRVSKGMDLVLASNMISVGIDISRWDIMLMSGQPRSTSEYIQSSSRVGRTHKGLVVNLYSPQRIREFSMYENFTSYHNAYYRYVEPLSATPVTIQTISNKVLNNIRACYIQHLLNGLDDDEIRDEIVNDFTTRLGIDDELQEYLREELTERWGNNQNNDYVSSLRDIDPNRYLMISNIEY